MGLSRKVTCTDYATPVAAPGNYKLSVNGSPETVAANGGDARACGSFMLPLAAFR